MIVMYLQYMYLTLCECLLEFPWFDNELDSCRNFLYYGNLLNVIFDICLYCNYSEINYDDSKNTIRIYRLIFLLKFWNTIDSLAVLKKFSLNFYSLFVGTIL